MASRVCGAAASIAALAAAVTVPAFTAPAASLVLAGAAASAACTGNDCASDTQAWGSCTQGDRLDADTWESTPLTGADWLDLHGERTWVLDPSPWMGSREPIGFAAYVSLDPRPVDDGGGGFANPAGNITEMTPFVEGGVWKVRVLNDTCARYYLRVVLTYAPADGGAAPGSCGG